MQYKISNNLITKNFTFDSIGINYQIIIIYYIWDYVLKQNFALTIKDEKYIIAKKIIPKFFN